MADMQNLVERLERAVGRLEAVSHASDMHCGYGDSAPKGKQYSARWNILSENSVSWSEIYFLSVFSPLGPTSQNA